MLETYIPVQGSIGALRVILKTEWMKMKEELRSIKQELASLNPSSMYHIPKIQPVEVERSASKQKVGAGGGLRCEPGSIVRIKNLAQ